MYQKIRWIADKITRNIAANINPEDVEELICDAMSLHRSPDPIRVSDRELIGQFILALRHAESPRDVPAKLNRADNLIFVFKATDKEQTSNEQKRRALFRFYAPEARDNFGEKFQEAMAALSRYETDQIKRKIQAHRLDVDFIELDGTKIDDSTDKEAWLSALMEIDERAFDFTKPNCCFIVFLYLQSGEIINLPFLFEHNPHYVTENNLSPPLPKMIWDYYVVYFDQLQQRKMERYRIERQKYLDIQSRSNKVRGENF